MGKVFLATVGLFAAAAAWFLFRVGYFSPVASSVESISALSLVFLDHVGPYHLIVPKIDEVERKVQKLNLKCQSFGEYLDDPKSMAEDRLRSRGGCIVGESELNTIKRNAAFSDSQSKFETRAPFRALTLKWSGAPSFSPLVVYPRAHQELTARGLKPLGPVMELYDLAKGETTYYFAIE